MTKIFALGTTGYIGGDALYSISTAHPEYEWTCLVRNSDKGALIAKQYPKVKLVYGDLDSSDLITEESAKADIVCNWANCDHAGAATAIIAGLSQRSAPTFYIHTSGTAILMIHDQQLNLFGVESTRVYDDITSITEITSFPDQAWHRDVDKIVLGASSSSSSIRTAIVCPPCIYGLGRGPVNARSSQIPELTRWTLKRGKGFTVGEGQARWSSVHVQDLSALFLKLVEAAASGGGQAAWGQEGYYFAENGEFEWGVMAGLVAKECAKRGFIKSAEIDHLSPEEVEKLVGNAFLGPIWGQNSRSRASRGRQLLGWEPTKPSLQDEIARNVELEAEALGLVKTHAEVAAGNA
ncbi:NAD-dependent epimerase/dehydratase [Macrophomina phaseolina MS6]|uniref:NAD-dependent epimerase/dehydratase n=1 Tax=Macrophomina phaseolina (strain MS6) TaxID=1126212 RepID=K2RKW4_MACPH|nr:NAD-dependent epimerase/dehydratase [Macrophomina phaseolina MS6]